MNHLSRPAALAIALAVLCCTAALADPTVTDRRQLNATDVGDESSPDLARIQDGGFAAVYETSQHADEADNRLLLRRFAATGLPLDDTDINVETNANNTNDQPAIAGNAAGNIAVAWTTYEQLTTGLDVKYRVFNSAGAAIRNEDDVWPLVQDKEGGQEKPAVDMAADGTFVIVWNAQDADGSSEPLLDGAIYARRYHANGDPMTDREFVGFTQTDDGEPAVSVGDDGSFVVGWNDYRTGSHAMIRRFVTSQPPGQDLQLEPIGDAVSVGTGMSGLHSYPRPLVLGDRVLVAWQVTVGTSDVYARRYTSGLEPVGPAAVVPTHVAGNEWTPDLAQAADGSIGISWTDESLAKWRQFDIDLTPLTGEITVGEYSESTNPIVGTGYQFVVAWEAEANPATDSESEVFARRYVLPSPPGGTNTPPPGTGDPPATTDSPGTTDNPQTNNAPAGLLPLPRFSAIGRFPKACKNRRLRLRFGHPAGLELAKVVVRVNGKRRKPLTGPGTVKLSKLPKRKVVVDIRATLTDGRTIKARKSYRSCR